MSGEMKKKGNANSRRNLLKATAVGTGAILAGKSLPEEWTRPLVESVSLPAHAQTSVTSVGGSLLLSVAGVDESFIDGLVKPAYAISSSVASGVLCFDRNGDGTVDVRALIEVTDGCHIDMAYLTGTVNQGVNANLTLQNGDCFIPNAAATVTVTMNGSGASGSFEFTNADLTATSAFNLSDPGCSIGVVPSPCDRGFTGPC